MSKKNNQDLMSAFMDSYVDEELESFDEVIDLEKIRAAQETAREESKVPKLENIDDFEDIESMDIALEQELDEDESFENWDGEEDIDDLNNEVYSDELTSLEREIIDWQPEQPEYRRGFVVNKFNIDGWVGSLHLDKILTDAVIEGASDVHISADQTISFTRNGDIARRYEYEVPTQEIMHSLIHEGILSQQDQAIFNTELSFDGSYTIQHGPLAKYFKQRTRLNVSRTFGNYSMVFRIINDTIPPLKSLEVEDEIVSWGDNPNGLILLCGPTGTGKSTTIASVIRNIQQTTRKKIITIENPVEYIYPDDSDGLVIQAEVGNDTLGFYEGLTSAMRQHPNVIVLGEVRNTEEVQELLRAAETGHLAISTMHTNSVATTISRIQNLFSGEDQKRIMSTLSDSLRGVGNQVLVKDRKDGMFAVRELLTVDEEIRELILNGDIKGIRGHQMKHKKTLEHNLVKAIKSGRCLKSEAAKHTSDSMLFNKLIKEEGL